MDLSAWQKGQKMLPPIPPLPREIQITNVARGATGSSNAAVIARRDATVTADIVGDRDQVFSIGRVEVLVLNVDPDGPGGHPIRVWEVERSVMGPGPISLAEGDAVRVFVEFTAPLDPPSGSFAATVDLDGVGAIPVFATANLGRLDIEVVSRPLILPGETENFGLEVLSTIGHEVSGVLTAAAEQHNFTAPPQNLSVPAGGKTPLALPITCLPGTLPGEHVVSLTIRSFDDQTLLAQGQLVVDVTRSVNVVASLPTSFNLGVGESVRCVLKATVSGGATDLTIDTSMPSGLSASPAIQIVHVDGTAFVGLDIAAAQTGNFDFTISWSVKNPDISGDLSFDCTVNNDVPQALLFRPPTLGPSTVTANAIWVFTSAGFHIFQGNIHESGVIGHKYGYGLQLNVTDANGVGFAVVHSGSVPPNLPFIDANDSWRDVGFDQRIADNWRTIASPSTRVHAGLNVDSNVLQFVLGALGISAVALLAGGGSQHIECDDPQVSVVGGGNDGPQEGAGVQVTTRCRVK